MASQTSRRKRVQFCVRQEPLAFGRKGCDSATEAGEVGQQGDQKGWIEERWKQNSALVDADTLGNETYRGD